MLKLADTSGHAEAFVRKSYDGEIVELWCACGCVVGGFGLGEARRKHREHVAEVTR